MTNLCFTFCKLWSCSSIPLTSCWYVMSSHFSAMSKWNYFWSHCKVSVTHGIWGLKFLLKIRIHPCVSLGVSANWDDSWMSDSACGTIFPFPGVDCKKGVKLRCNSALQMIFVHFRGLVNIKAAWYFQPVRPHLVLYALSDVIIYFLQWK
jgi:hypothetical protein